MRSLQRQTQDLYFSVKTMGYDGIDEVSTYTTPELHRFTVSATGSTPDDFAVGIVPDYDRYITSFDRTFTDRFSSSLISSICQDRQGSIWIATDYGLNKFDGYRFATYLHKNGDEVGEYHGDND